MEQKFIEEFSEQLQNVARDLKQELLGIRANRPTSALLENIPVTYYGQTLPMKHVASISVHPPREIIVSAWDKEAVSSIIKAIETSSLGLTPQAEGTTVRVKLPELSAERREELIRHVKKLAEQFRIRVRHARDEANKKSQKLCDEQGITEDEKFRAKDATQKKTDGAKTIIDDLLASKIREIQE